MLYTVQAMTDDAKAKAIKDAEGKGHRITQENTYSADELDAEGNKHTVLAYYEMVIDDSPDKTPLPIVDPKAQLSAALTTDAKVNVIAKYLGLS